MLQVYWGCLITGIIFALIAIIFGDLLDNALDGLFDALSFDVHDFFEPVVLRGWITAFGGAGVMLTKYTSLDTLPVLVLAILISLLMSIGVYFVYVKPMKNAENSVSISIKELVGRVGEVIVPIPVNGYGEVLIRSGAGHTNQIAASIDGETLVMGTEVVVKEVRDDTLFVSPVEK